MAYILNWFVPQAQDNPAAFVRYTYNGIAEGAILALVSVGLVLIYKATDVINFAHGEFMMLGAYIAYEMLVEFKVSFLGIDGLGLVPALIAAAVIMGLLGILVERLILRPLVGEPVISVIMVTIGLSSIIHAGVGLQWGTDAKTWQVRDTALADGILAQVPEVFPEDSEIRQDLETGAYEREIEGSRRPVRFQYDKVYIVLIVSVVILALIFFFKYSKQGIAMRATADDQQASLSMGISVKRIFAITWSIAAMTAGIAGLIVADTGGGAKTDIPGVGLRAFPVIILGGLDSIAGAIVGGLMIGLLEQYAVGYIDPLLQENFASLASASTKNVVPYLVLVVILMFKPYGLFGQKRIERV
ncbi:MAG: branched-chain amino acid ABC transporter permease [Chloroflexi bacterium]|nr:branched-chain amino acid ABC transporter permease [Chloroflexota bacterium]NOG63477.1 branched-chain amino acid ABC transporter permease [Chloroflexota bacterium]